jgi:hypothetical protein
MFIVGVASMMTSGSGNYTLGQSITGIFLIMLGITLGSAQFVLQEYVMKRYVVSPTRLVGLEGVFGVPIAMIVTFCFVGVPCPDPAMCEMGGSIDSPVAAVIQIFSDWEIALLVVALLFSIKFFNIAGLIVTRNINSVIRSYLDTTRTVLVWVIFLVG